METCDQKIHLAEEEVRKLTESEKSRLKEKKRLEAEIQEMAKENGGEEEQLRKLQEDSARK